MRTHELAKYLLTLPDSEVLLSLDGDHPECKLMGDDKVWGFTKLHGRGLIDICTTSTNSVYFLFEEVDEMRMDYE
jgi:hypothetical protein